MTFALWVNWHGEAVDDSRFVCGIPIVVNWNELMTSGFEGPVTLLALEAKLCLRMKVHDAHVEGKGACLFVSPLPTTVSPPYLITNFADVGVLYQGNVTFEPEKPFEKRLASSRESLFSVRGDRWFGLITIPQSQVFLKTKTCHLFAFATAADATFQSGPVFSSQHVDVKYGEIEVG